MSFFFDNLNEPKDFLMILHEVLVYQQYHHYFVSFSFSSLSFDLLGVKVAKSRSISLDNRWYFICYNLFLSQLFYR